MDCDDVYGFAALCMAPCMRLCEWLCVWLCVWLNVWLCGSGGGSGRACDERATRTWSPTGGRGGSICPYRRRPYRWSSGEASQGHSQGRSGGVSGRAAASQAMRRDARTAPACVFIVVLTPPRPRGQSGRWRLSVAPCINLRCAPRCHAHTPGRVSHFCGYQCCRLCRPLHPYHLPPHPSPFLIGPSNTVRAAHATARL